MPGETGQDLPQSVTNMQERTPSSNRVDSVARTVRGLAQNLFGKNPEASKIPPLAPPAAEVAPAPGEEPKETWLYEKKEELADLPDEVAVALIMVKNLEGRSGLMVTNSLSRAYQQIEAQVFSGKVGADRVVDYLIQLNDRIEALDQESRRQGVEPIVDAVKDLKSGIDEMVGAQRESKDAILESRRELKYVKIENPEDPESQVKGIFLSLNELEERASREGKIFEDKGEYEAWAQEIREAIRRIPDDVSNRPEFRQPGLENLAVPRREIYLKETLSIIFEARRRLHNRKTEIGLSGGALSKIVPANEASGNLNRALTVDFTDINPVHWYALIHHDDLLKNASADREIAVPIADALSLWREVGENWDKKVAGLPVAFNKEVLSNNSKMSELRAAISSKVGLQAEQAAFDIFTVTFSLNKWDKLREYGGTDDIRDMMYFDDKRVDDWYKKGRAAGPEDTVGAYFSRPHQGEVSATDDPDYTDNSAKGDPNKDPIKKRKLDILKENRKRTAVVMKDGLLPQGQLVGDLWESVSMPNKQTIQAFLEANGGDWKKIPFETFGEGFYAGYVGYSFGFVGESSQKALKEREVDPRVVVNADFWFKNGTLLGRIKDVSPPLIAMNDKDKQAAVNAIKRNFALGVFWALSHKAQSQSEGSWWDEFRGHKPRALITAEDGQRIMDAIVRSNYLPAEERVKLAKEINKNYKNWAPPQQRR